MIDFIAEAREDARTMGQHFLTEIVTQLFEEGEATYDLYSPYYTDGDQYHHETHVDRFYSLGDAVEVIDQLAEHEEGDSGLWEGQDMKTALGTCAAYTYSNAVMHEWHKLIEEINEDEEIQELLEMANLDDQDPNHMKVATDLVREIIG